MLQVLLSGQGFHTINGVTHTLHAGQCILYDPNAPQHIIHYGADDPVMAWIHFYGHGATELVEDLKLQGMSSALKVE